jgi:hypothetical protein
MMELFNIKIIEIRRESHVAKNPVWLITLQ